MASTLGSPVYDSLSANITRLQLDFSLQAFHDRLSGHVDSHPRKADTRMRSLLPSSQTVVHFDEIFVKIPHPSTV